MLKERWILFEEIIEWAVHIFIRIVSILREYTPILPLAMPRIEKGILPRMSLLKIALRFAPKFAESLRLLRKILIPILR